MNETKARLRKELVAKRDRHRSPLVEACVRDFLAGRRFPLDLFSPDFA